ncbi:MAG: AAA family ATPase [Bifidobacteriaceae bacterium]|jgi:hypothetical protein|nr:AAA family ATPase [Bifidobacteriaceae bacterium]
MLEIVGYPVIMWIVGKPGMGKTWQLRRHLDSLGFSVHSVSAADLESSHGGEPAKALQERYIAAGQDLDKGKPAALVVDDIDTTLREWEKSSGAVNQQDILTFLMHIADSPVDIETDGALRQVPTFFTGNDESRLYAPLAKHGRTTRFNWEPTTDEKAAIVASILRLHPSSQEIACQLVSLYPSQPLSFFSHLVSTRTVAALASEASIATFSAVAGGNTTYADQLRQRVEAARWNADWLQAARELQDDEERLHGWHLDGDLHLYETAASSRSGSA